MQRVQAVRGRLYFSYRPAQVLLAADPDAATHQAFGVPAFDFVEGDAALWPFRFTMQQFRSVLINPTGEMPSPRNDFEANPVLNEKGGFQPSEVNQQIVAAPKRRHVPPTAASGQPTRRS